MGLMDFPVELLEQVAGFLESPSDFASLALVNILFSNISRPHFARFLTVAIPPCGGSWGIQSRLEKITKRQLRDLRHIEVIHSTEIKRWGASDINVNLPDDRELEEMRKRGYEEEIDRRKHGAPEDPDMALVSFNEKLAQLIRSLRPGQLQSFRFNRHSYGRVFHRVEVDRQILAALTSPQTRLTSLTLTFDPCLQYDDCSAFDFPYLRYLRYNCYDVSMRYHRVFSLLSSCQDTLEELHCANWKPQGRSFGDGADSRPKMVIGFESWKRCDECANICQMVGLDGEKRIHLKKLKTWKCNGYSSYISNMAEIFEYNGILKDVRLRKYSDSNSIGFSVPDANSEGVYWERYFCYPVTGVPWSNSQLNDFLEATAGFEKLTIEGLPSPKFPWDWVEGLGYGHRDSLRKLKLKGWALHASEEDVEYIGNSLPNLEELTVEMKDSIWTDFMPDCIFDNSIFPKLRIFRSSGAPRKNDSTLREKCCEKTLCGVIGGKLPPNLQKVYVGTANYIFFIDREPEPKRLLETTGVSNLEEMLFEEKLTVDEALGMFGIKVTEIRNQNRRTTWQGSGNEVYESEIRDLSQP
ncbi:hypothetical protein TWF481_006577 [Arthrobotrys musiformis]|uniref:F-box domain-containing protein n=1 Tax=Arthrobotrys musiformis TaxID=47236 RepID=A0AAV9W8Z1_9PEZI